MTGEDVRQVVEAIWPHQEIERVCAEFGVIERPRKLHLGMLVRALVIAAGTPGGADQGDVLRSYREFAGPRVARSACYRWFDEPLEQFMAALAARALAYAGAQQVDLTGIVGGVTAWDSVDSPTVRGRAALQDEFPGAGDYAARKGHTVLAVGCGAPVRAHFSPAREPDRRPLQIDASWPGCGLLADLAYASRARLRAWNSQGVRFVIRLTDNWQPQIASVARGHVTPDFCPGTDLDVLLKEELLVLDGRAMDADVRVGGANNPVPLRLVGGPTPKGSGFFLTHLPPRLGPRQVAAMYRVRWEVELRSKLEKAIHRVDQVDTERSCSVKTLRHAARIASMIAALLAHTHNRETRPAEAGAPRTAAPLHPRRLALQLAVSCQSIAQACDRKGARAKERWQQIADVLIHRGRDPTWRRRPAVLDQLRGWTRQPVVRPQTNRRHLKAAA